MRLIYSAAIQAGRLKVSPRRSIAAILISAALLAAAQPVHAQPPPPGNDSLGGDYGPQQDPVRNGVKQDNIHMVQVRPASRATSIP